MCPVPVISGTTERLELELAAVPDPTPEQLAEWRAVVERVQAGDESGLTAWAEGKAAGRTAGAAYRILATPRAWEQLAAAPPAVRGTVAGIVAVLRVDPVVGSVAFTTRLVGEVHRARLAGERDVLTYQVIVWRQLVILLDVTGIEGQPPQATAPAIPAT